MTADPYASPASIVAAIYDERDMREWTVSFAPAPATETSAEAVCPTDRSRHSHCHAALHIRAQTACPLGLPAWHDARA